RPWRSTAGTAWARTTERVGGEFPAGPPSMGVARRRTRDEVAVDPLCRGQMHSRRRGAVPWLVVAALVAVVLWVDGAHQGPADGFPRLAGAPAAHVERVVDGDTVRFVGIGPVRLIGIDTPEVHGQVECYGPEASAFTA